MVGEIAASRVDGTAERLFRTGLCMPSGSGTTNADQERVIEHVLDLARK